MWTWTLRYWNIGFPQQTDLAGPVAFSALFCSTMNPPFQIWHHERHPGPQFLDQQSGRPSPAHLFLCIVCRHQDSPVGLAVASAKTLMGRRANNVKLKQHWTKGDCMYFYIIIDRSVSQITILSFWPDNRPALQIPLITISDYESVEGKWKWKFHIDSKIAVFIFFQLFFLFFFQLLFHSWIQLDKSHILSILNFHLNNDFWVQ